MSGKEFIVNALKSRKTIMSGLGVRSVGLFGSYVREEQSENSDIDILVDFDPDHENFDNYMALYDLLDELFADKRVEIVTKNGLSPYIGPKILNEVEYV